MSGWMRRIVLSLLAAIALLAVPFGMIGGMATAHVAGSSVSATADCHQPAPGKSEAPKGPGMSAECALACAALPAAPPRVEAPSRLALVVHQSVPLPRFAGAAPESDDPPSTNLTLGYRTIPDRAGTTQPSD